MSQDACWLCMSKIVSTRQTCTAYIICHSCFYQLRQLKSLTREALHSRIQAFVHCRLDYCNSVLLEWPKFTYRNFSLCRKWLLIWCLEWAEVNTSHQFLKIYIGCKSASSLQDGLDGLEVCSWCRSSLSHRPLHTRYCHLRSSASAICSDCHSPGSTHPDCNWTMKFCSQRPSHMKQSASSTTVTGPVGECLQAGTKDEPVLDRPAPLRRFHDSGAGYKY